MNKTEINKTIQNWRLGNDNDGLKFFWKFLDNLEKLAKINENEVLFFENVELELLVLLEELEKRIDNKDFISITDILEFRFLPFLEALEKEVDF